MDKRWLVGFIEGEGCFNISFAKDQSSKFGYRPRGMFIIKLIESEEEVIAEIWDFLGRIGNIYHESSKSTRKIGLKNARDCVSIRVTKLSDLQKIVNLLKDEKFISKQNRQDFEKWAEGIEILRNKEHHTKKGFIRLAVLREQMHTRKHPTKKDFCELRNIVEICDPHKEFKGIPKECDICITKDIRIE